MKLDQKLFHTGDLATIWGITNKNTLYTAISRYVKKGILVQVCKGFYSTVQIDSLNPLRLGLSFLHRFAYVTAETILQREGIIFQSSGYFTLVSSVSKKFEIKQNSFLVRKLADKYLYNDDGVILKDGIRQAAVERAAADLLYFSSTYHFDNRQGIDWIKVRAIQKGVYGK